MSMVFLLEKDKDGTYRVKPVQAKAVPLIVCREATKLVLVTPMPATTKEVEAYAAKYIRDDLPRTSQRTAGEINVVVGSPAQVEVETEETMDVLAEAGPDDSDELLGSGASD